MNARDIQKKLEERFGAAVGPVEEGRTEFWIEVDPDRIDEIAAYLAADPELRFDCLSNQTGVDQPDKDCITVVYNLMSYEHGHELTIKVDTDRERPVVNTVEGTWKAANWLEREIYDLLGIEFAGHSDLRRILLPDDWVGHPLRKDYVESPEYHGISTIRESMLDIPGRS
jgi:NADH-quinone oxidoreductase subunit C